MAFDTNTYDWTKSAGSVFGNSGSGYNWSDTSGINWNQTPSVDWGGSFNPSLSGRDWTDRSSRSGTDWGQILGTATKAMDAVSAARGYQSSQGRSSRSQPIVTGNQATVAYNDPSMQIIYPATRRSQTTETRGGGGGVGGIIGGLAAPLAGLGMATGVFGPLAMPIAGLVGAGARMF